MVARLARKIADPLSVLQNRHAIAIQSTDHRARGTWTERAHRQTRLGLERGAYRRLELFLELLPGEQEAMERMPTEDMGAYDDYLRGRHFWNRRTEADFERAVEYLESAIRKDAKFARAHAALADTYNLMGGYAFRPAREVFPKAKEAARRAMEHGVRKVDVLVKGPGSGRETAIRSIQNAGIEVVGIKDVTPIPHNGCRPPKRRRV